MAPEVLKGTDTKASPALDIWALGCMLFCMFFYKFPFDGDTAQQVKDRIISAELRFPRDRPHTEEFADLIRGILTKDPTKRYDMNIIKQHKWMLLSDNAINLKVELAKQNYEREQEKRKQMEEEKKLQQLNNPMLTLKPEAGTKTVLGGLKAPPEDYKIEEPSPGSKV